MKLTDEQVELEIERLRKNKDVQLSLKNEKLKYKRRQLLYTYRWHAKNGKRLRDAGITEEMLESEDL